MDCHRYCFLVRRLTQPICIDNLDREVRSCIRLADQVLQALLELPPIATLFADAFSCDTIHFDWVPSCLPNLGFFSKSLSPLGVAPCNLCLLLGFRLDLQALSHNGTDSYHFYPLCCLLFLHLFLSHILDCG